MFSFLLVILFAVGTAFGTVYVVNSPDSQLPPVARVNQHYSWKLSPNTFDFSGGSAQITASFNASWLYFDSGSQTFSGTPSDQDEGTVNIQILASDGDSFVCPNVTLVVASSPAPTLRQSIQQQFYSGNPSLSSVFLLSPGSAITTAYPTLRVPPGWSFSIGFTGDMFNSDRGVSYNALQSDGSPLFDWMVFNPESITLNGVAPEDGYSYPRVLSLNLHVSDYEGYTSSVLPFDIVIAENELSLLSSTLPTINITASTPFNLSLSSPDDFHGVLVNGRAIHPSDIHTLSIDVSHYSGWLKYDELSRTLSGTPPDDLISPSDLLPVTLTATFNQTLTTNFSLAIVPSYFSTPTLTPIHANVQDSVRFNLAQYFSNVTIPGIQRDDVNLTAAFKPEIFDGHLDFDPQNAILSGYIFANCSLESLTVTFTAYSHMTHSTSHTTLPISISSSRGSKKEISHSRPRGLSASAHAKLILGLTIAFGFIGGLALLGSLLAAFRHWARVNDTALEGEASRNAWTDSDRKWYGIQTGQGSDVNGGYLWSDKAGRPAMEIENPFNLGPCKVGGLGLGLQRVLTRTPSNPQTSRFSNPILAPGGVMRKGEFLGKIKETVRKVSDKYAPGRSVQRRPAIGKPVLVTPVDGMGGYQDEVLPFEKVPGVEGAENPFEAVGPRTCAASTIGTLSDSPTSSSEDRSIPRRRADFAPVKSPLVQTEGVGHDRKLSTDSLASNLSARLHAEEAVIRTATRTTSIRSARSGSAMSYQSLLLESPQVAKTRARLVPFTNATRVPVPRLPSENVNDPDKIRSRLNPRAASQMATVIDVDRPGTVDDLTMGIHYVRSLGGDGRASGGSTSGLFYADPSTASVGTNVRSSFSSLASSWHTNGLRGERVKRYLVRTGERFKFRVDLGEEVGDKAAIVRMISGRPVPAFLKVQLDGVIQTGRRMVEFSGIPGSGDTGEVNLAVVTSDEKVCARLIVEVVGRRSS